MGKKEDTLFRQAEICLRDSNAGSRSMDTLEDIRVRMQEVSSDQERRKLLDRLEVLLGQADNQTSPQIDMGLEEQKKKMAGRIKDRLNASHQYCMGLAERETEANETIGREFIQDLRGIGNVEVHAPQMETREKFQSLVLRENEKLESRVKLALKEPAEQFVNEYEHTMNRICEMFEKTDELALHVSRKEIYQKILTEQDSFLETLRVKGGNLCTDSSELIELSNRCGKKLETITAGKRRIQKIWQWLPVLLVLFAEIVNYVVNKVMAFQQIEGKEGLPSRLERVMDAVINSSYLVLFVVLFGGTIAILYYFYIKWVNRNSRKALNKALQAYIQPEIERFIKKYSFREALFTVMTEYISQVERQYAAKYQWLFSKLEPAADNIENQNELDRLKQEIKALY